MSELRLSHRRRTLAGALLLSLTPSLAGATEFDAPSSRIYGGEPAATCEWPTTVGLGGCTGTLIHPRVVLYAAHCGTGIKTVQFGEEYRKSISHKVKTVTCKRNPAFKGNSSLGRGVDSAYCVLEKPVESVPIAPVIYGCETEALKPDATIWLVGFGKNNNTDGHAKSGKKFKVETDLVKLKAEGRELEVGSGGKTACNGDSGGPAFMKMEDGTWRTIGITSYGVDTSCTKVAYYGNAAKALPWIQESLDSSEFKDIDLTPCFEANGDWAPSEKCGGFAKDPGTAYGSWDNFCSEGAPLSGASSTCGEPNPDAGSPEGGKKDEEAPSVEITSPGDDDSFEVDKSITVKVKAKDNVDEDPDVVLLVDGDEQKTLEEGPYRWKLEDLKPGKHTLVAKATDEAGNSDSSKKIEIEIKKKKKEDPSDDSSDSNSKSPGSEDDSNSKDGDDKGDSLPDGCSVSDSAPLGALSSLLLLLGWRRRRQ